MAKSIKLIKKDLLFQECSERDEPPPILEKKPEPEPELEDVQETLFTDEEAPFLI